MLNGNVTIYTIRYVIGDVNVINSVNVPYNEEEEVSAIISYSCRHYNVILDTIL